MLATSISAHDPQKGFVLGPRLGSKTHVSKTPYKHQLHTKEARAERDLLSNLFRQSRKIISAVK